MANTNLQSPEAVEKILDSPNERMLVVQGSLDIVLKLLGSRARRILVLVVTPIVYMKRWGTIHVKEHEEK